MANCRRFGHKITNLCGTPAGVKEIYLANYSDLVDYRLYPDEVILSGITMDGEAIPIVKNIGDIYQGGVVFYTWNGGTEGLICAQDDFSGKTFWTGCAQTSVYTNENIGYGLSSTINIMNSCSNGSMAAWWCHNANISGYTDWYLPSKLEWEQILLNENLIGNFKKSMGDTYWSSFQITSNSAMYATPYYSLPTSLGGAGGTYQSKWVRPIRTFGPTYITKSWYKVSIPRQTALFLTEALIHIPNGVAQSIPKLDFKVIGLDETILKFYDQVKQTTLVAVVKTLDDQFYALGFQNGLDTVECTIGTTENRESGFKGATFVLKGTEKDPMYLLDPDGIGKCFPNCSGDCDILVDINISLEYLGGLSITYMNC